MPSSIPWEQKIQVARHYRDASLSKVHPPLSFSDSKVQVNSQSLPSELLTQREIELTTAYTTTELLTQLQKRTTTAEELTRAFLRRAAVAHHATNCLTELMWDEAMERAKYLDSLPSPLGPLHGLPISIKEHQGMHLYKKNINCAYAAWVDEKPSPFSPLNQILWDAGCVFFARTNQPQTLQCIETNNNIYGRTVNPWNRGLSSGGSSGGEGALIGMRGSVLGVGGDIGGSVRVPAANNGLYGFKPTAKRIGIAGCMATMAGNEGLQATYGPICTDRDTIEVFMKTFLDAQPWRMDPLLETRLWEPVRMERPLKVAIMWSDDVVQPHPPVLRALKHVSDKCKTAGMKVVDWKALTHQRAWEQIYLGLLYPDGAADTLKPLHDIGEPVLPLIEWLTTLPDVKTLTIPEYWRIVARREVYRGKHAAHWNATADEDGQEVDVILCPAGPGVAPLHDTAMYWSYTSIWNLLDYPAVAFPSGLFVDPALDAQDMSYSPVSDQDANNHALYEAEKFVGAPIGLQLVARKGMDEFLIAALKEIERAMGRS